MLMHGENGQGLFPWALPLWQPDYAIFFGVLYAVILVLAIGLSLVFARALADVHTSDRKEH